MTRVFLFGAFVVSTLARAQTPPARVPVLVELFTSEGCSSCPPADAALAKLVETQPVPGAEVIALELHVDYWNRLGWADPFSSEAFSARQAAYSPDGNVYTPQMIVDGARGFVGELPRAVEEVRAAARAEKGRMSLSVAGETVSVDVASLPRGGAAELWLAVTEDGLSTAVPRGENAGRTLRHAAVVRAVQRLGPAEVGTRRVALPSSPSWNAAHLRVVAWAEDRQSHRVIAAAAAALR